MLLLLSMGLASAQSTQGKPELDRASLQAGTAQLVQTIERAVAENGGDLNRQNVHLVIAFSTGHYKTDPLGAQAAREVATRLVSSFTVPGDRVSSRAWELDTWSTRDPASLSIPITQDRAADQARAASLWPTTLAVGSLGGHDTERAATSLAKEFANDAGTVLVLLTNTAASVGASGANAKLMGANAPEYLDMLKHWTRVQGTQDGATMNLPYLVHVPARDIQGQMQAVVFVPKTFTSASLTSPRPDLLKSVSAAPAKPSSSSSGKGAVGVVLGLIVLAGAGFAAYRMLGSGGKRRGSVRVGDQEFALQDLPKNRPFCVLAGAGYSADTDIAVVPLQGVPPEPLAELTLVGQELKIRTTGEVFTLDTVGGQVPTSSTSTLRLRPEAPDTQLEFSGEVKGPGGVPRTVQRNLTISYLQGV
ncbi:hypothetical protein [Deinococcus sonorensis]|uniref:VWFA domain-containing protein n=2 Tax=Deinococcus sonorensis TaxID=309891 RepID=A0AAU7UF29_9DEIO